METNKLEKYNNLISQNYKTLNEILEENNISRSQIASIRKYAKFLDSVLVYHPKAKKEVNLYSQKIADEIIKYANLSKVEKSKTISLLKYGVENKSQLEETRKKLSEINKANSTERTKKRNKTNMERYGTCDFINSDKAKKPLLKNTEALRIIMLKWERRERKDLRMLLKNFVKKMIVPCFRKYTNLV